MAAPVGCRGGVVIVAVQHRRTHSAAPLIAVRTATGAATTEGAPTSFAYLRVGLEMPILALNRGLGNVARHQTSTLR
jgi:hypothetical protein